MYNQKFKTVLAKRYTAQIHQHYLELSILMDKPVGLGDHTNYIDEAHKHIQAIANAKEQLDIVEGMDHWIQ